MSTSTKPPKLHVVHSHLYVNRFLYTSTYFRTRCKLFFTATRGLVTHWYIVTAAAWEAPPIAPPIAFINDRSLVWPFKTNCGRRWSVNAYGRLTIKRVKRRITLRLKRQIRRSESNWTDSESIMTSPAIVSKMLAKKISSLSCGNPSKETTKGR